MPEIPLDLFYSLSGAKKLLRARQLYADFLQQESRRVSFDVATATAVIFPKSPDAGRRMFESARLMIDALIGETVNKSVDEQQYEDLRQKYERIVGMSIDSVEFKQRVEASVQRIKRKAG